jgi:hypothetical protein
MELETVPSASQNAALHEAIGGMRYLVRATTIMPESARVSVEEMVRKLSRETIELAEKVRDALHTFFRLEDELQTDGRLDSSLVIAGLLANALEHLTGTAKEHSIPDWLMADMKRLREIAEEYRDIEETLALGRSRSFQHELQEAKREAAK